MAVSRETNGVRVLADRLLDLAPEHREAALEAAGFLDAAGLDALLDDAERSLGSDPGKAERLARLCGEMARSRGIPAAVPRADYVLAGVHGIHGRFADELALTRRAREGYAALGRDWEALRTNVGLMGVLIELGRYDEVLAAGREVLEALGGEHSPRVSATDEQADLLVALVQQNLGGCYEYMGRYGEALGAYGVSEELYRSLGLTERLGEVLSNRGAVLMNLGRGNDALRAHRRAADIFERAGLTLLHAKALANVGEAQLRLSNHTAGLESLERARRHFAALGAPVEEHLLLLDTADAYLQLNLYGEALAAYEEVNEYLRDAGIFHNRARTLWGMGSALVARSEFSEADRALRGAAEMFATAENLPMRSGVLLERASLLAARGERDQALAFAGEALESVRGGERPVHQVYAHLRLADLMLPDTAAAERHLDAAREVSSRLALPHLSYRLDERLGHLRRLQGRREEAHELLERAIAQIERLRDSVGQEAIRASFLRDKLAAYEDLLLLHLERGDEQGDRLAFAAAERAKSRALVDLLTGVVRDAELDGELAGELAGLRADLNATYGELLSTDEETPVPELRSRALGLERAISRLQLRASPGNPFVSPATPSDAVPATDEVLLAYHVVGDEVLAFVRTHDELHVERDVGSVDTVGRLLRQLDSQWNRFRAGPAFARRHAALLERSTRSLLAGLHGLLVAPLEPVLARIEARGEASSGGALRLTVVPHGVLHRVPFHALYDGSRYLLERFEVVYAPSARVHAICRDRNGSPVAPPRSLVVGVADDLIPAAATEARAAANRLPEAELLVGEEATLDALREGTPGKGFVHLACHGLFRSDNPMFSSLRLHDGWMTAADALGLDLSSALVTLSACETGRSEVFGGDELIGLTRAFLGAGASSLVVSLWVVQDDSTALFMDRWYARLREGVGRAHALRDTQLDLMQLLPHPYYWAPFVLIGHR